MDKPTIEIKNLKIAEFASDETLCFGCTVYVNGKKAFTAENHGTGGDNNYYMIDKDLYLLAENYAKSLPPMNFDGTMLDYDLDLYLSELIEQKQENDWLKRSCKKQTLFTLPGDEKGKYRTVKHVFDAGVKAFIENKYPQAEIINLRFA